MKWAAAICRKSCLGCVGLSPAPRAQSCGCDLDPGACAPGFTLTVRFADSGKPAPQAKRTFCAKLPGESKKIMRIIAVQTGLEPDSNLGGCITDREFLTRLADRGVEIHLLTEHGAPVVKHQNLFAHY